MQLELFNKIKSYKEHDRKIASIKKQLEFFMLPTEFVMLPLPLSKDNKKTYSISNSAGVCVTINAHKDFELPSGKYARLILMHLFTFLTINKDTGYIDIPSISNFKKLLGITSKNVDKKIKQQLFNIINATFTINSNNGNFTFSISDYIACTTYSTRIFFTKEFINYLDNSKLIKINKDVNTFAKLKSRAIDFLIKISYKAFQNLMRIKVLNDINKLKILYNQSGLKSSLSYFKKTFNKLLTVENAFILYSEPI